MSLDIVLDAPPLCSDQTGSLALRASGGTAPYVWNIQAPSGWSPATTSGARANISVPASKAGKYTLVVSLADAANGHANRTFTVVVLETPRVTTTLPHACPGQAYTAPLAATGGDASAYRWTATSQADAGIALDADTISVSPSAPGTLSFDVTVSDGNCTSEPTDVSIDVDPVGPGSCPSIGPEELPAPCAWTSYGPQQFTVASGDAKSAVWKAIQVPEGLTFDANTATLSGHLTEAGPLIVELTDAAGHRVQKRYPLSPRSECWLAYTATDATGKHLHLYDPVLNRQDRALPALPGVPAAVEDFAFSPDGKHLAYRTMDGAHHQVVVLSAPDFDEQPVAVTGSVGQYAWSADSGVLAVAFTNGKNSYIGGVDFRGAAGRTDGDGGVDASAPPGPRLLVAEPSAIDSPITWYANDAIAYSTPSSYEGNDEVFGATLGDSGFSTTPVDDAFEFASPTTLLPAQRGIYVVSSGEPSVSFYGLPTIAYQYFGDAVPDPNGRYAARAEGSQLQLYRASPADAGVAPWLSSASRCGRMLAWAKNKERVACTSDAAGTDKAALFDLEANPTKLEPTTIVGTDTYTEGAAFQHRRAFAPSGDWLAFTIQGTLHVGSFADGTPHAEPVTPADVRMPATEALAFAPDESMLLWQSGDRLFYYSLINRDGKAYPLSENVASPPPCSEGFAKSPRTWCGAPPPTSSFVWASDSRFLAAQYTSGAIDVYDMRKPTVPSTHACEIACGPNFNFQP